MAKKATWHRWLGPIAEVCSIASFARFIIQYAWSHWADMPVSSKSTIIVGVVFAAIALAFRSYDRAKLSATKRKVVTTVLARESNTGSALTQYDVIVISAYIAMGMFVLLWLSMWLGAWVNAFRDIHPQAPWYQWFEWWNR